MKNKGFTIIELMIVVAILGILAAIIMGVIRDGGLDGNQPINSQPVNTGTQASELAICRMVHPHYLSDYGRQRCQNGE